MDICFDTSAINALCDDIDKDVLQAAIKKSHRALLTSLNVVEVVATPDSTRRRDLLETMRGMWDQTRPLVMPNKLVRRATKAFGKGKPMVALTILGDDAAFWHLLDRPESAGAQEQAEALAWKESLEAPFKQAHRDARQPFQDLFMKNMGSRPRSLAGLLRSFKGQGKDGAVYSVVKRIYKKDVGQHLSLDAMWRLFEKVPQWPLYLAGWGHEMFFRVIQTSHYSAKGKPGTLDLWSAVYLPHCDAFITSDKGQYRALRFLNVMSRRIPPAATRTRVLMYRRFKSEVLCSSSLP